MVLHIKCVLQRVVKILISAILVSFDEKEVCMGFQRYEAVVFENFLFRLLQRQELRD